MTAESNIHHRRALRKLAGSRGSIFPAFEQHAVIRPRDAANNDIVGLIWCQHLAGRRPQRPSTSALDNDLRVRAGTSRIPALSRVEARRRIDDRHEQLTQPSKHSKHTGRVRRAASRGLASNGSGSVRRGQSVVPGLAPSASPPTSAMSQSVASMTAVPNDVPLTPRLLARYSHAASLIKPFPSHQQNA